LNLESLTNLYDLIKINPTSKPHFSTALNLMLSSLEDSLDPKFYVLPFDTGFGKSTLIKDFLRVWKAEGFKGRGSVLIALNTKAEIAEFATSCGLGNADYAAYTSDDEINMLGAGADKKGLVPVLFTTQAMLRARLAKKGFCKAEEFFFHGQPRTLRLWDERCDRAETIHITRDGLLKLFDPIRPYCPEWIEGIEKFLALVKRSPFGTVLTVPLRFGTGRQFVPFDGVAPILTPDVVEAYKQLKRAAGKRLRVCAGKMFGKTLVGAGNPLPADLAPMLIFDGSARIGETYKLWAETGNVVILPPLVRDYRNLIVRIWKTGSGREALENADKRDWLLNGIAKTLNLDPQPTLLIGSKARPSVFDLHAELAAYLDNPADLFFRHWGIHYGTNAFANTKRLVVVGEHRNRDTVNQAICMAASGIDPAAAMGSEEKDIALAEMKQNLLQAFSRGNLRNGVNGECGECVVYLIAPPTPDPEAMVRETFPGCRVEAWEPYGTKLTGQAKAVFDVLKAMVDAGRTGDVTKFEVRSAAVIASKARFGQVLANPTFVNAIRAIGVSVVNKHFVIRPLASVVSLSGMLARRRKPSNVDSIAA
jgi:hypothetical protein